MIDLHRQGLETRKRLCYAAPGRTNAEAEHRRTFVVGYVPSPLLYGDKLYVFSSNNAVLSCYQAETGEVNFEPTRLEGLSGVYASPVGAADRVYIVSRDGKTAVIKRSKDLEVLATNTLDEGFDASPVVVDNELFLRGKEYLYCISAN